MSSGTDGRWPARRRDESGQITFFVLCSFFTFFMFFALVANVGQAVNRRVLLQMVADAGAFSGASAQASAMNTISELNQIIDTSWDWTEALMLYFTFQFCGADDAITGAYSGIETAMSVMIRVANHGGVAWSFMEAEMVTRENIKNLFRDGSVVTPLDLNADLFSNPLSSVLHGVNLLEAWPALQSLSLVRLEQDSVTKNWICYTPPFSVSAKSGSFNLPWEKSDEEEVTRFYWWVRAKPVRALVMAKRPWLPFGFPKLPQMEAVALAKPVGGDIEPDGLGGEYVAKMIPLSIIDAKFLNFGGGLPSLTEVLH